MILLTMINSQKAKARENAKKAAFDELLFNAQTYDYPYSKHDILHPVNIMLDPVLSRLEKQKNWIKNNQNKIKVFYIQAAGDPGCQYIESQWSEWTTPGELTEDSNDTFINFIEDPFKVLSRPENSKYSFLKEYFSSYEEKVVNNEEIPF